MPPVSFKLTCFRRTPSAWPYSSTSGSPPRLRDVEEMLVQRGIEASRVGKRPNDHLSWRAGLGRSVERQGRRDERQGRDGDLYD